MSNIIGCKIIVPFICLVLLNLSICAQTSTNKGQVYFGWGYNVSAYTKSNIHFIGNDYDFTLFGVIAKDRPTPLALNPYFNPKQFTIPQYNAKLGYFIKNNLHISFEFDHMKYVVQFLQNIKISGSINKDNGIFNGYYDNKDMLLKSNFLQYEHTDGLNFINLNIGKTIPLLASKREIIQIMVNYGLGVGILYPKTNCTLFNEARYDAFNVAGFGSSINGSFRFSFGKHIFIQTESKIGYINLPNVRITQDLTNKAKQSFAFIQGNAILGASFPLCKKGT